MKRVDTAQHHTGKGEKGSKIIALPKQANRVVYLAGSLTAYAFKKKDSEKEEKEARVWGTQGKPCTRDTRKVQ